MKQPAANVLKSQKLKKNWVDNLESKIVRQNLGLADNLPGSYRGIKETWETRIRN